MDYGITYGLPPAVTALLVLLFVGVPLTGLVYAVVCILRGELR